MPSLALPALFTLLPRPLLASLLLLGAGAAQAATVTVQVNGSDGKGLLEAVVYLESTAARAAARPLPGLEVEQVDKRFAPRVVVVPTGSAVNFPNRDRVRHHVYSLSATKPFEIKLFSGVPANPVVFDRPGVAVLGCNIHDNMVAWVVVVDTPHYGISGADGRIRIDNVPPGTYRLRAWHPGLPPGQAALDQPLQLGADRASATVVLPVTGGGL